MGTRWDVLFEGFGGHPSTVAVPCVCKYSVMQIFTFWEPAATVTPYVALCRQTWERHLDGNQVVTLDYSNLRDFLGADWLRVPYFNRLGLAQQKDVIMVDVLHQHGGVFLDLDTIMVGDPTSLWQQSAQVTTIASHLAMMVAERGSWWLEVWLNRIHQRLPLLAHYEGAVPWNFVGNSVLADMFRDAATRRDFGQSDETNEERVAALFRPPPQSTRVARLRSTANRSVTFRRDARAVEHRYPDIWRRLDRRQIGYMPEFDSPRVRYRRAEEVYRNFWFGPSKSTDSAQRAGQTLIGLHNSWTPQWYRDLSSDDVLRQNCLLSGTLRGAL